MITNVHRHIPNVYGAVCARYVSTPTFERVWRIVRKPNSAKFFVFNNQQRFESHPLRQISHCVSIRYIQELSSVCPSLAFLAHFRTSKSQNQA